MLDDITYPFPISNGATVGRSGKQKWAGVSVMLSAPGDSDPVLVSYGLFTGNVNFLLWETNLVKSQLQ